MITVLTAAAVLGGGAMVLALLLSAAARRLHVPVDERVEAIVALLPGNNCGACGYPGCHAFAEALIAGTTVPAQCTVSSAGATAHVAAQLGVAAGEVTRRVARLACAGGSNVARLRANYVGPPSCAAATASAGGGKACTWGCLGYGDCVEVCDFDALTLDRHGLPVVDTAACTACGDCVDACPKDLFSLQPVTHRLWVACRNEASGNDLLDDCAVACTGCARCAFDAPGGVSMRGGLAVVDYQAAQERTAIERCPTGAIVWIDDDDRFVKGREATVIVRQGPRRAAAT